MPPGPHTPFITSVLACRGISFFSPDEDSCINRRNVGKFLTCFYVFSASRAWLNLFIITTSSGKKCFSLCMFASNTCTVFRLSTICSPCDGCGWCRCPWWQARNTYSFWVTYCKHFTPFLQSSQMQNKSWSIFIAVTAEVDPLTSKHERFLWTYKVTLYCETALCDE